MNMTIREWCWCAWTTTAAMPGTVGYDLRARWEAHANRDNVVVTFFGPYDSGKSSLLKRLLVDDDRPVLDWLTVSGRRETFERQEAPVMGVVVCDTPGIATGNESHEQIAEEALLLSDVVLLVLPPQLVTSNRDTIVSVMNGSRFNCSPQVAYPPYGLVIVLSRMDEAGVMPRDDLRGYVALVDRKREELRQFLRSEGVPEDLVAILPVAADPFGLVGNSVPDGRHEYDADREWDGVAAVADFLKGLAARKSELRLYSEVRFLGAELGALEASLAHMEVEIRTAAEVAENEALSYGLVQERLKALLGAARADLDRRIEEEISAATRRGAADDEELRGVVLARLEGTLERWCKEHDATLEMLLREADVEMKVRRDRPAWKKLAEVLDGGSPKPEPTRSANGPGKAVDKVQRLTKMLHKGFREAQPVVLDMPLEKARNELQRFRQAASFEEYAKQTRKGAVRLRDLAHAAQARRTVILDLGFGVAVPALLELVELLGEWRVKHKDAEQRAARRVEVRRVINDSSKELAERAWGLWRDEGMPAALEVALEETLASAEGASKVLEAESAGIAQALASVIDRLDELHKLVIP